MKQQKQRTLPQNNSLHLYLKDLSDKFNEAGYDQAFIIEKLNEDFHIPWTKESLKNIFRQLSKIMYDVDSTSKLETDEIQEVYKVFDKKMSEITGIHIEWPSEESLRFKAIYKDEK